MNEIAQMEQEIRSIWIGVLESPEIDIDDDFFDLGGDSIMVAEVITRINNLLNLELGVIELFEHATLRALTARLRSLQPHSSGDGTIRSA